MTPDPPTTEPPVPPPPPFALSTDLEADEEDVDLAGDEEADLEEAQQLSEDTIREERVYLGDYPSPYLPISRETRLPSKLESRART